MKVLVYEPVFHNYKGLCGDMIMHITVRNLITRFLGSNPTFIKRLEFLFHLIYRIKQDILKENLITLICFTNRTITPQLTGYKQVREFCARKWWHCNAFFYKLDLTSRKWKYLFPILNWLKCMQHQCNKDPTLYGNKRNPITQEMSSSQRSGLIWVFECIHIDLWWFTMIWINISDLGISNPNIMVISQIDYWPCIPDQRCCNNNKNW